MSTPFHRPAILDWLVPSGQRVLDLTSGSSGFARALTTHRPDLEVITVDHDPAAAHRHRLDSHLVARAESLPLANQSVDVVTSIQSLHLLAPGLVLDEAARVLSPSGSLAVSYTVRDDSVPWVRRFADLVRRHDPDAMQGEWGQSSIAALADHPYFHAAETHEFAAWVPASHEALVAMVLARPTIAGLPEDERTGISAEIGELYRSMSRGNHQLVLPYRVRCWRARVNHSEVPVTSSPADEALHIRL